MNLAACCASVKPPGFGGFGSSMISNAASKKRAIRHLAHSTIEYGFPVCPAIVDAIQADDGSLKVKANSIGDARHQWKGFAQ
jgi:hypothetical protein